MYSYFSDLHVQLLAKGLLEPGEQLVGQTVGERNPWWALGLFRQTYLALATNERLILVEHRLSWFHTAMKLVSVETIPWSNVQETRLKGIFAKKIRLQAQTQAGPKNLTMKVPNALFGLLAPMRNNMQGAKSVVSAFQTSRQLGAAAAPASLPPPSFAPPPQQLPQQFEPQMFAPASQQNPVFAAAPQPEINSQGYTSVPPPPPQGYAPFPPTPAAFAAPPRPAPQQQQQQFAPPGAPPGAPRPYNPRS